MSNRFSGVWPAMLTPYDEQGRPNLAAVDQLVETFIGEKLGGIYLLGSTGQGVMLSAEERRAVAERTVRAARGRIPVMVHVGAVTTEEAVALAKHAAEIKADAVSSVGPIYFRCGTDAVFEHYSRIGAAAKLPFYVYHLSYVNTLSLRGAQYVERLLTIPNIAGMKYTELDLYQLGLIRAHAGDRLTLFSGADELICQAVLSGADGAIGTFYNVYGASCRDARAACLAGKIDECRRFMLVFQAVIDEVLASGSTWSFLRAAVRLQHKIDVGAARPPLGLGEKPWDDDKVKQLLRRVEDAAAGCRAALR